MEDAQSASEQTAGRLSRLDGVRFLICEYEDPDRRGRHGYLFHHGLSRNGREAFRRPDPAVVRTEDATLESLLDREQNREDRASSGWFLRPKRRRPFLRQRHPERKADLSRLPLGRPEQRAPAL